VRDWTGRIDVEVMPLSLGRNTSYV
jgi:hypothetical protein